MTDLTEFRSLAGNLVKLTATDEAEMRFEGYGSVFGNTDDYGDMIVPGAFAASLAAHREAGTRPLMFLNHKLRDSLPIGIWEEAAEDGYGLKVKGRLLDTPEGRAVYVALKAGAISGLSIGFTPIDFVRRSKADEPRITWKSVNLLEVSVVTFPANAKARIQEVRSIADQMTVRDLESLLRELGCSKSESITVASQFKAISGGDVIDPIADIALLDPTMSAEGVVEPEKKSAEVEALERLIATLRK